MTPQSIPLHFDRIVIRRQKLAAVDFLVDRGIEDFYPVVTNGRLLLDGVPDELVGAGRQVVKAAARSR